MSNPASTVYRLSLEREAMALREEIDNAKASLPRVFTREELIQVQTYLEPRKRRLRQLQLALRKLP